MTNTWSEKILRHQKGYKHQIKIRGILQLNVCINNLVFIVTLSEWTKSVRCMFIPFLPSYLRRLDSCVQVLTPLCMLLLRSQVLHWVVANIYCQYIYPHSCTLTSQFWYAAPSDVLHNQNKLHCTLAKRERQFPSPGILTGFLFDSSVGSMQIARLSCKPLFIIEIMTLSSTFTVYFLNT